MKLLYTLPDNVRLPFEVENKMDDRTRMLLYGFIGPSNQGRWIDAVAFCNEMYYHAAQGRKIVCYINSYGGSVWDGRTMCQAILDTDADTHIVGVAASMAGIVHVQGKKRTANDFSQLMIHYPSGSSDSKLLEMVAEQLSMSLTNSSKFTEDEIKSIVKRGAKDYWMDSSMMWEKGLIDSKPIYTGKKITSACKNAEEFYNICSSIVDSPKDEPKKRNMKSICAALGLNEEASETAILKAVDKTIARNEELENQIKSLEKTNKELKEKQDVIEASLKTQREAAAKTFVDNLVATGKIKEDAKPAWLKIAQEDIANATVLASGLAATKGKTQMRESISNELEVVDTTLTEDETYEFLAEYNPEKLKALFENDLPRFNKLSDDYNRRMKAAQDKAFRESKQAAKK